MNKTLFRDQIHAQRTAKNAQLKDPSRSYLIDQVIWGTSPAWIIYILDAEGRIIGRL